MESKASSSTSFPDLKVTESECSESDSEEDKSIRKIKKKSYKKRKPSKKPVVQTTFKYTLEEITEAINLLNAKDAFFDHPHKFQKMFCIQNSYKYDSRRFVSLDSLNLLFQEAVECLENQDWRTFVQIIIKALQFPKTTRSLVKNFVLMEVLYDPVIKNSEIAQKCLSLMFGGNIKYDELIKTLTQVPLSVEHLSDEEESESESTEVA